MRQFWIVWLVITLTIVWTKGLGAGVLVFAAGYAISLWLQRQDDKPTTASDAELVDRVANLVVARLEGRLRALEQRLAQVHSAEAVQPAEPAPSAQVVPAPLQPEPPPVQREQMEPVRAEEPVPPSLVVRATPLPADTSEPIPMPEPMQPPQPPQVHMPPHRPPPPPADKPLLESLREQLPTPVATFLFDGSLLVKGGVLILFLGLIFLLRYTAEHVTVSIGARYAGVALTGIALLQLGWYLRTRRTDYALIVQGAGIGVLYLTIMAAIRLHHLLDPLAGFVLLSLVAVLSAALAVLQNAPVLAIVAALEGFFAPVLVSTGANNALGLFCYLAILDVGVALVAWFKAWRILHLIAFVGTLTLASAWGHRHYSDDQYLMVQCFLLFFFLLFALIGFLFAHRSLREAEHAADTDLAQRAADTVRLVGRVDSALTFGLPFSVYALQYLLVKDGAYNAALAALGYGFFYVALAFVVLRQRIAGLHLLAEAYLIVGAIFGTLAIPLGLEGQWTGAAWAVEGAGMYWLGLRQHRLYARLLAFPVMAGATWKLLHEIRIVALPDAPLLDGSLLGPLLLAISVLALWGMQLRARPLLQEDARTSRAAAWEAWELRAGALLPWLGIGALNLLPWMLMYPIWAAAGTAALALATHMVAGRYQLPALQRIVVAQQALAVAGFLATLHRSTGNRADAVAVLGNGWRGMLVAVWIAATVLGTTVRALLQTGRTALADGRAPAWPMLHSLVMIVGMVLLHLAVLFVASWQQVAWIWPMTSGLLLWGALRFGHAPLALLAAMLQAIAAGVASDWHRDAEPVFNAAFLTWMVLGLTGLLEAWWIARRALRVLAREAPYHLLTPWCARPWAVWLPLCWGLGWWLGAWGVELQHFSFVRESPLTLPQAVAGVFLVTTLLLAALARRLDWRQAGSATLILLPALFYCAHWATHNAGHGAYVPSDHGGWLVWPLALVLHLHVLKVRRAQWWSSEFNATLHVCGFWLFLVLAATEVRGHLRLLGDPWSSWPVLGFVAVPALALWALQTATWGQRWPLRDFRIAYVQWGGAPVALWMLLWLWASNTTAGAADPLPYLPLLNPLELGQALVLLALILWLRSLRTEVWFNHQLKVAAVATVGLTALALVSGLVLRACHHFGGVPWDFGSLFDSRLAQAALSVVWATCAVATMLVSKRVASRSLWLAGAALLAVVVLKLFAIELSDSEGLYRIVSFIGVGVLLLLVGYFAPVPAKKEGESP